MILLVPTLLIAKQPDLGIDFGGRIGHFRVVLSGMSWLFIVGGFIAAVLAFRHPLVFLDARLPKNTGINPARS